MTKRLYLDHNATTITSPDVVEAMMAALALDGNPSAQHADGRAANAIVSRARETVSLAMGVCSQDLIFTSGGTEGCNTAIWSGLKAGCRRLLISPMDHPATINAAENFCEIFGARTEMIPVDAQGRTDMVWLKDSLANWEQADGRPFVSIVAANSETGVIQDIETATDLVEAAGGLLLVDATQAFGKIPMTFQADYLAVSAHKVGGPKGVGALYVSADAPFAPLLSGGGQERRRRSGTHNVAGIAGFGKACEKLMDLGHSQSCRDRLEAELTAIEPNIVFFGAEAARLPNTSFFAVPDASSMTLMMGLDLQGISVSTGTACSSGKTGESRAIRAMGRTAEAPKGAIRVSFGENANVNEVEDFLTAWMKIRRIKSKSEAA
ncbi:cysteine desulfurase [Litorimonas cladophorae]|uniref:Cysteine desulfurase n=1 Tax=Litorimonas cladophorae TaxID=1220491 RepID=A0A918KFJ9_9PROT|nr:cysteine desulfurase family protein [Litorimonas cladophorae]GGX59200.1 cysteine desulfurase [Litorimonas cladophorae]